MRVRFCQSAVPRRATPLRAAAAVIGAISFGACSTDAQGIGSCRQIEEARCRQAPVCPSIRLTPPYTTSGTAVDACIQYYDVACLHGLEVGDPGPTAVQACIHAIQTNGCSVVATPQSDPACLWLIPPANLPEASADAAGEGGDASPE